MKSTNPTPAQQDASKQSTQSTAQQGQEGQKSGEKRGGKQEANSGVAADATSKR